MWNFSYRIPRRFHRDHSHGPHDHHHHHHGHSHDVETRKSLLIEMSTSEIVDFVTSTGLIAEAFDELHDAFWNYVDQATVNAVIQNVEQKIEATLLTWVAKMLAAVI